MNTDTGEIRRCTANELAASIARWDPVVEVNEKDMTPKQREEGRVSLHDTRSTLGRKLHGARSSYMPHVGAKQLEKVERRRATLEGLRWVANAP